MRSVWNQFELSSDSVWDRFGIDLESMWGRFGIGLGSVWGRSGIKSERRAKLGDRVSPPIIFDFEHQLLGLGAPDLGCKSCRPRLWLEHVPAARARTFSEIILHKF